MKSLAKRAAALGMAALLASTTLAGCGSKAEEEKGIDGTATVVTVNEDKVPLGVAAFYARYQQAQLYQLYQMYFGTAQIFDQSYDENGLSYGDEMKDEIMSDIQKMVVVSQHAADYSVELTDDEKAAIEAAAQDYIDKNDEETRAKIGASKDDVVKIMELQTIQSKMMDPIVADVDTTVTDEEAQQTTLTYIPITVPTELPTESEAESAVTEVESVLEDAALTTDSAEASVANAENTDSVNTVEVTASGAEAVVESTTESVAEEISVDPELAAYAEAQAEKVLAAAQAVDDIANADLDEVAKSVKDSYYTSNGQFTKADPTDTDLDANLVEAVAGLEDGTLVDHVVKSTTGETYYVVRLDQNIDNDATLAKEEDIITERKQAKYDEVVDGWVEEATITVDDDVWAGFSITDSEAFTLVAAPVESTVESVAESVVESAAAVTEVEAPADETSAAETVSTAS